MVVEKRSLFSSKIGFVLAAAGSAVGLGNIWRFPYLAAKYGGGIFLLVYIILVLTFGFTLMVTEIALGRKTGLSVIGAYRALNKKWAFLGVLSAVVPIIIVPYYSVIGGWVTKYFADFISGAGTATAGDGYFNAFVSSEMDAFILVCGVYRGDFRDRIYGGGKGHRKSEQDIDACIDRPYGRDHDLFPYASRRGRRRSLLLYAGLFQSFPRKRCLPRWGTCLYSMSLAMGIMVTYGSYMNKKAGPRTICKTDRNI